LLFKNKKNIIPQNVGLKARFWLVNRGTYSLWF